MGKNLAGLPKSFTREDLMRVIESTAKAAAKETASAIDEMNRKNARRSDPGKAAQRMLADYRRLKLAQKEDIDISEDEMREMRYSYLEDLMGALDHRIVTEDVIYAREKKRLYNQYKIRRIETAVSLFEEECDSSGSDEALRRCRTVKMRYIGENAMSVEEIAAKECVSRNTVYHDLDLACRAIAVYLSAF